MHTLHQIKPTGLPFWLRPWRDVCDERGVTFVVDAAPTLVVTHALGVGGDAVTAPLIASTACKAQHRVA